MHTSPWWDQRDPAALFCVDAGVAERVLWKGFCWEPVMSSCTNSWWTFFFTPFFCAARQLSICMDVFIPIAGLLGVLGSEGFVLSTQIDQAPSSFLCLVAMPEALNSVLVPSSDALCS